MDISAEVGSLLGSLPWIRQLKIPRGAHLRAFMAECELNRGLIRLVDLNGTSQHDAAAYRFISLRLKSDVLASLLTGDENAEVLYKTLEGVPLAPAPDDEVDSATPPSGLEIESDPRSVAEHLVRLYVAVASLQAAVVLLELPNAKNGAEGLRTIRVRQRLRNLDASFAIASRALRGYLTR